MQRFIQIHLLTAYPPANMNRDDFGRPKTAKMGGFDRLRISSQSLKRAWRTSDIFESKIKNGVRTKMIGIDAFKKLSRFPALSRSDQEGIAKNIAQVFGSIKKDSLELDTLAFISDTERTKIDNVIDSFKNGISGATEESNALGVKLFALLCEEVRTPISELIEVLKVKNQVAKFSDEWSKELRKLAKKYTTSEDKSPYDFIAKMIASKDAWLAGISGNTEVRDDQLELLFAEDHAKTTKEILKKLSLGDLLSGKNAKETEYGEVKHKEHIKLCKGWQDQVADWIKEVRESEDDDLTSKENIQKLELAVSPIAVAKSTILTNDHTNVDIALFGRMLASSTKHNVDAACQVAHAISVHPVVIEDDYFTAVEDLNQYREDAGAAHIGETGFAAGLFYSYLCINKELLIRNLINNFSEDVALDDEKFRDKRVLADTAIQALIETCIKVPPEGKQNSFGSRAYASYVLAEKGDQQPRSLSVAFLKPITSQDGDDYGLAAIEALVRHQENMDKVYGQCADSRCSLNAITGQGSLAELLKFVSE